MSLGVGESQALDGVVNRTVDPGMRFTAAVGNHNRNACSYPLAVADKVSTIRASTLGEVYFSNYGECVDVFIPGEYFYSSHFGSERSL